MAQRQYMRKIRTGSARFPDVYRAVSEYRQQYPDKAVIYSAQKAPELCWAALMAGGSCTAIPVKDKAFLEELALMAPRPFDHSLIYQMEGPNGYLVYNDTADFTLDLKPGKYALYQIDAKSGAISFLRDVTESVPLSNHRIWWLKRK